MLALTLISIASAAQVVGGTQVAEGDWEDAAAIYFGNSVECTGVLVASNVVLTAGHCAGGITAVKVGTNDYREGGEKIAVSETIAYPGWASTYDISVLVLAEHAKTPPRIIAQDCILEEHLQDGASVQIVGYGATDNYGYQYGTELNEATTTIDDADCSSLQTGCNAQVSPDGELGAGGADDVDSCYGDSGGPLYLLTDKGDYLIGLTSRAYNNAWPPCGMGGIYVRPDAIIDWIEEVSGATLPAPDCITNTAPAPTADALTVPSGSTGTVLVDPGDPDADDEHTFSVVEGPSYGTASIDADGLLSYTSEEGYTGEDEVVVVVTDLAEATGEVSIPITVMPRQSSDTDGGAGDDESSAVITGCGCASSPQPMGTAGMLVGLVMLLGYRRRD